MRRHAFECVVVCQLSGDELAEDDAEGENVGGETKLLPDQDLGAHVRVGAAKRQPPELLRVPRRDPREPKVGDLQAAVGGEEEVLPLEVSVDALPCVQVCQGAGNVNREGEAKAPGKRQTFVVDVSTKVSVGDILGDNVDGS